MTKVKPLLSLLLLNPELLLALAPEILQEPERQLTTILSTTISKLTISPILMPSVLKLLLATLSHLR